MLLSIQILTVAGSYGGKKKVEVIDIETGKEPMNQKTSKVPKKQKVSLSSCNINTYLSHNKKHYSQKPSQESAKICKLI